MIYVVVEQFPNTNYANDNAHPIRAFRLEADAEACVNEDPEVRYVVEVQLS